MTGQPTIVKDPQVSAWELSGFFFATIVVSATWVFLSGPYIEPGVGSEAATAWFREKAIVIIWAPMSFALAMAAGFRGTGGLKLIGSRLDPRGIGLRWWLLALLLPMLVHFLPIVISGGFTERSVAELLSVWGSAFALLIFIMLGEEVGWRGYALPALQARRSPFIASLILGSLWAAWHFPVWFGLGYGPEGSVATGVAAVALSTFGIVALALILTWFANSTNACILVALLYHASNNATLRIYGSGEGSAAFLVSTAVVIVVAASIVAWDRKRFFSSPERLSGEET